jgi:hypothetical protein
MYIFPQSAIANEIIKQKIPCGVFVKKKKKKCHLALFT